MPKKTIDIKKKGGKHQVVKDIMAKGFTARKAEKALKAVIDHMKLGLWWGEPVETPLGTLKAKVRRGKPWRENRHKFRNVNLGNVNRGMTDARPVDYPGRRRVVKFQPNPMLDLTPLPQPPAPETTEQIEARELASYLLGKEVDRQAVAALQRAAETKRCVLGSLVRRLKEFKDRGWHFDSFFKLEVHVADWHWV
jgi:hypothetical protein